MPTAIMMRSSDQTYGSRFLREKSHNPMSRPTAAPWLAMPPSRNPVMMVHGFERYSTGS